MSAAANKTAKKTAKKTRYEVLITRTQIYRFDVEAKSPEAACAALWRRLRFDNNPAAPSDAHLAGSVWSDPRERGDAWLIAGATLAPDPTGKTCYGWDGKKIVTTRLA